MRKLAALLAIALAVGAPLWWLLQRQRALDVALIQAAYRIDALRIADVIKVEKIWPKN